MLAVRAIPPRLIVSQKFVGIISTVSNISCIAEAILAPAYQKVDMNTLYVQQNLIQ